MKILIAIITLSISLSIQAGDFSYTKSSKSYKRYNTKVASFTAKKKSARVKKYERSKYMHSVCDKIYARTGISHKIDRRRRNSRAKCKNRY